MVRDLVTWRLRSRFASEDDLVVPSAVGTPQLPSNLIRRVLPASERAWNPVPRHSCASRLFRAGLDAKRVQLILGHHAVSFALQTYVHPLPGDLPDLDAWGLGLSRDTDLRPQEVRA